MFPVVVPCYLFRYRLHLFSCFLQCAWQTPLVFMIWGSERGVLEDICLVSLISASGWFLAWLVFYPECESYFFLRKVCWVSADHTALYSRRQKCPDILLSCFFARCLKLVRKSWINKCFLGSESSWKAVSRYATHQLPNILRNPKVVITFTRALHWFLSWFRSI
jgi:hypothetical protein